MMIEKIFITKFVWYVFILIHLFGCGTNDGGLCEYQKFSIKFRLVSQNDLGEYERYIFEPIKRKEFKGTIDIEEYTLSEALLDNVPEISIGDEVTIRGDRIIKGGCTPYVVHSITY